jgi:hypothetical protein
MPRAGDQTVFAPVNHGSQIFILSLGEWFSL